MPLIGLRDCWTDWGPVMKERTARPSVAGRDLAPLLGRRRPMRGPAPGLGDGDGDGEPRASRAASGVAGSDGAPSHQSRHEAGRPAVAPLAAVVGLLRHRALRETERPGLASRRPRPRPSMPGPAKASGIRRRPCRRPLSSMPWRNVPAVTAPSPLATPLSLKAAPFEPTDLRFPINLATALRLSDARPLIVAAAQARVWVAEAELTQAKVLWVPELNIGFDYIRHDGGGPDFNKGIMTAPSMNFFYGGAGLYGVHLRDRCHLPAPGGPAGPERPALGHPVREERRPAPDRRRLLPGAPVPGDLCRLPLHGRAGARRGRADRHPEPRPGLRVRGRPGPQHARRPRAAGRLGAAAVARPERQTHEGAPARPPRGGRAAGARPPPDHPDRPGPGAR